MTWNEIQKSLKQLPPERLIELIKGLHHLSPQNKAWLQALLLPKEQNSQYLEDCRSKVIKLVYNPARVNPEMPKFREAKNIISTYKAATKDLPGTLDLMLTYVESGHSFTNDYGDIDDPFYERLINMLENFAKELKKNPAGDELYARFRLRLQKMNRTADIGWGYGDYVHETVADLEKEFWA